jgi:hypothetical protein
MHAREVDLDEAVAARAAVARVRAVAASQGVPGVVLTRPGPVAWTTAGLNAPIDRTAGTDVVWLAVGPDRAVVVTTDVEGPRLAAEAGLVPGTTLVTVPWWDADAMVEAASSALGHPPSELGADGHPGFGINLDHALTADRLVLDAGQRGRLRALGRDAAAAVEAALRAWSPGETDRQVAGRIAGAVEATGADAPVLLVGGDDRVRRFRHPVAVGAPVRELVMAVLVARRAGLHVALTRYAAVGPAATDPGLASGLATCRRIHRAVLRAGRPGATVGEILRVLDTRYAAEGHPKAWRQHYQGGPIGYAQREFELSPAQTTDAWWGHALAAHTAVAWNPSLPGGAKDEDTYLIGDEGTPELVTRTGDWPVDDDPDEQVEPGAGSPLRRPAVLVRDV